ncbi:DNA glycosylase [Mycolicibacter engbaekii]|uniref:DNA-(apurinic or apyrimidinic site) lyase n=1 Tax=Mycolicibacter engbaekii TaxID=188915 RepID=A0A1X1TXH2_9MYCO|nr:endonuclease VIII Nei2 [Mycolicibacter engbaekii]ORV49282.1 DNA glycosylase [Mycolicibacter engbaekii]
MPEGDTVFRAATMLATALAGKTLTRCDIRVPRYAGVDLSGQRVDEVVSRGKHLFIRVGSSSIHSHLKMDGCWRIGHRSVDHRVRIILEAGSTRATGIDLGILEVLDRRHDGAAVAHLGPDLLGADWDPAAATARLMSDPQRPVASALLDQTVMAGVGNVFCNELCFVIGRLPTAPVGDIGDPGRLVALARQMLWANRLRSTRCTTGDTRRGRHLWVYGRDGSPCRRCGTTVRSDRQGERIRFWCPSCQR